jgi:hypothetical protein
MDAGSKVDANHTGTRRDVEINATDDTKASPREPVEPSSANQDLGSRLVDEPVRISRSTPTATRMSSAT